MCINHIWCGHKKSFYLAITSGRRWLPIFPWSWLYLDTLWIERVPWENLTGGSGCVPLCVKIPVSLLQRRLYLASWIWLAFERWFLFCDFLPRPCSLLCHVLFLGISTVWWWFTPRFAPGRCLCLSAIVSLWHFWHRFYVCGMSGIPYRPDGGSYCNVEVHGVFYKMVYTLSEGCVWICSPLWY